LLIAASVFLRSIKKPTTMGIKIKINERQIRTKPTVDGKLWLLNVPFPLAVSAPNKQINKPGQPHNTTDAMVATIPFVFVSIFISPLVD
jgi:hypothetical protein